MLMISAVRTSSHEVVIVAIVHRSQVANRYKCHSCDLFYDAVSVWTRDELEKIWKEMVMA